MHSFARVTPLLQIRKAEAFPHDFPLQNAVRRKGLLGIVSMASLLLTATGVQAQFGPVNVGATSGNQSIQVTATAGTLSSVEVLTLGSASGDFAVGTGVSTCPSANLSAGGSCTESVTFKPVTPGLRLGAVVLTGTVGGVETVLGTQYISGTGTGGLGVLIAGNLIPVAGQPTKYLGPVGDGNAATNAKLDTPGGAVLDGAGNMYVADSGHNRIRMVCDIAATVVPPPNPTPPPTATIAGTSCTVPGIISTIVGNGDAGYTGDGGPAANPTVTVSGPGFVALDGAGNLYIADTGNNAIRMINAATGVITTVAGNALGTVCGAKTDSVGDGCPATQATLNAPQGVTLDAGGNLYIADTFNNRIREVNAATRIITTIAGSGFTNPDGTGGYSGDGGPASSAELNWPYTVAFDPAGNMYIPDSQNNRVREVQATGGIVTPGSNIVTFAGTGGAGPTACAPAPAAVAATQAIVWIPSGVAVDAAGNVYIAETQNFAIRKVSAASGEISALVQSGCGNSYDTVTGLFAPVVLYGPTGLYLDGMGDLYIADTQDMVVDEVQGNYVALNISPLGSLSTAVRQGSYSPTVPQTVENDGNASLDLTAINRAPNSEVDYTAANSCSIPGPLAMNADCVVGAFFAPVSSPVLSANTVETPSIDVAENTLPTVVAPNSPLEIQLIATAEPLDSTTTTICSSTSPGISSCSGATSGFGQNVTFTVTVVTGANTGALSGTVSISDAYNGNTTTLASALPVTASGSTSATETSTATFNISTLGVGQHSITAIYNNTGDPNHTSSTSTPPLIQTVNEGTAVSLTSNSTLVGGTYYSLVGQPVTFTATVTSSAGSVVPTGTVTFFDGAILLVTQNLTAASDMVTYTTLTLANGPHQITAVYNPTSGTQLVTSTSNVVNQDVQVPSTITVVSGMNPSTYAASVTFTATITSAATSPASGTVTFLDNGVSIAPGTLSGNPGVATLTTSALPVGNDPITVTYPGDNFNAASSSAPPLSQVVNQAPTVTSVSATPNPGIAGTTETIKATVALTSGSAPFTGTVTFTSNGTTLGGGSVPVNASGVATITPTLAAGSYTIVATFSGDPNTVGSASAPFPYTVALVTTQTALTVMPSLGVILSPITFTATVTGNGVTPMGNVNFLSNGVVIGTSALSGGVATFTDSTLAAGSYTMTAVYVGNATEATSTSPNVSETIGLIPTTTALGTSSTSGLNPQVILVAGVINSSTGPEPSGTVTFFNGTTSLGTATVDASGAAALTPNLLTGTNYSIDAVYSGDAQHLPSTLQIITISGTASGFTVTVTPVTVTIPTSQNATVTVTLTSNGNFADTVGLGCSSLPAVVNCHFASISLVLPANGTVSTQLTIDTNNPLSGGVSAMNRRPGNGKFSLAGLILPLSLGFGCIFWRWRRRNAPILTMALILVLAVAAFVSAGCGGFSQATAAPGNYVIQVTGTGATTNVIEFQNVNLDITK